MKTLNSVIGVIIVALVGFFAIESIIKSAQKNGQAGAPKGGGGVGGGSSAPAGKGSVGQFLSNFFGGGPQNVLGPSFDPLGLNDPNNPSWFGPPPLDLSGLASEAPTFPDVPFPSSPGVVFDPTGGGAAGADTGNLLQTSYDDSSWQVS